MHGIQAHRGTTCYRKDTGVHICCKLVQEQEQEQEQEKVETTRSIIDH